MRTSRADRNFFSVAGNITNQDGFIGAEPPESLDPLTPSQFDAIFKSSGSNDLSYSFTHVDSGTECCADFNNLSRNVSVFAKTWGVPGLCTQRLIKIKGGSSGCSVGGFVQGYVWWGAAISLGEWSDQSTEPCRGNRLSGLTCEPGRKLKVAVGRSEWPTKSELGDYCEVSIFWSLCEKAYWWGKFALVRSGAWALYGKIFS